MFDHLPLEDIRDASEAAFAKIDHNPERIGELNDDDLACVAVHVKTTRPLMEAALVALCGDEAKANAALQRVMSQSKGKLVKLVRAAHAALRSPRRDPSVSQFAALVLDVQVGCGAVMVEQQRRQTLRAGRMH